MQVPSNNKHVYVKPLIAGDAVSWRSDGVHQGTYGGGGDALPYSEDGAGGGWQICFA